MGRIVAIGGGSIRRKGTLKIDREIIRLSRKKHPRLLYIPTASSDSERYCSGHSDSMSFYHPKKWEYIRVKGLGLIPAIHCPHYDSGTRGVKRRKKFQEMMKRVGGLGIAIDDNCAIEFIGDRFRVLSSKKNSGAYKVYRRKGHVIEERIVQTKNLQPLFSL